MSPAMVGATKKIFRSRSPKTAKTELFELFHLFKNIRINTKCTTIVHKLRFSVNFCKLGSYFHMHNRTKLRELYGLSVKTNLVYPNLKTTVWPHVRVSSACPGCHFIQNI